MCLSRIGPSQIRNYLLKRSRIGSENNIGSGSQFIAKIIMCLSLELALHYKLIIPVLYCLIFSSIHLLKMNFYNSIGTFREKEKGKGAEFNVKSGPEPDLKRNN